MSFKYKVGIIGCGRIASMLEEDPLRGKPCTHAGAYSVVNDTQITAGCDIDQKRLKKFGKRWNVKRLYTDYREMLKKESLDIISVAAWTRYHSEMVIEAAKSGVRGINCEKPIALNLRQANKMLKVCKENRVKLMINHERRWDPYYLGAKKIIEAGKIGELKTIVGNALSWSHGVRTIESYGGGPMFHDGTHLTDILRFFTGEPDWVSAYEERPHGTDYIEDTIFGLIQFKKGTRAFIEGGGCRKYFNFELDLQGTEGRIIIGNGIRELYISRKSNRFSGFKELEKVDLPISGKNPNPFINGIRDLIKCIETREESISSGYDGKKALEIIFALYKSARYSGRKVKIPS